MADPIETCKYKQETADYYVAEWKNEMASGWLVRELSEKTGMSITEALLFLNWMERFTQNRLSREHNEMVRGWIPKQTVLMDRMLEETDPNKNEWEK